MTINKRSSEAEEFRKLVADLIAMSSGFSIGDLYPSKKFISIITGTKSKLQELVNRLDRIIDPIIEEHMHEKRQGKEEGDLELFTAGGETSSTIIDWTICELLKNPEVMKKAQNEVRSVLPGKQSMIEEANLDKLKESIKSCEINSYEIPAKTRVFINAWAIGRDSRYWKDPEMFDPERFEGSSIDYKGTHFELIPFGAGRRMCPGMGLGIATVELVLAMLLYHFDWKLTQDDLDMEETFGIVGRRKNDLH
ncbi:Cytochrome P450 71D11, partial [Bienertia sinuspersici]